MPDPAPHGGTAHQLKLISWLSPAFPVGAFAYSHGLERAVEHGQVGDGASLRAWLLDLMRHGSARNDAILIAEAMRAHADSGEIDRLSKLAEALAGSQERHAETMLQGAAFCTAAQAYGLHATDLAYPVAFGALAGQHTIDVQPAIAAWLQSFASNQIQSAIRLSVLGQAEGVALLAGLAGEIEACASAAAQATEDDIGGCAMLAEIAAMQHETQYSRLFRT